MNAIAFGGISMDKIHDAVTGFQLPNGVILLYPFIDFSLQLKG
jgi:hypothetical protein